MPTTLHSAPTCALATCTCVRAPPLFIHSTALPLLQSKLAGLNSSSSPPTPSASPAIRATVIASPNHSARQGRGRPDMLVLHYTGMASADAALARLCAADSAVSSHYLVFDDGRIVQLVAEERRAFHAGVSSWEGETDVNSRSIGIFRAGLDWR